MNEWAVMWETLVNSGVPKDEATQRVKAAQAADAAEKSQNWADMWERLVAAGVPKEGATQRVLKAQRSLNPAERTRQIRNGVDNAMAAGDTTAARVLAEEAERIRPEKSQGYGTTWDPQAPREAGQEFGENVNPLTAFAIGRVRSAFGADRPALAVSEYLGSRLRGEPRSWSESMEFARGARAGAYEEHPWEYRAGAVVGALKDVPRVTAAATKAVPGVVKRVAKNVFSPRPEQAVRNLARTAAAISATGASYGGVTAAVEGEGVSSGATTGAVAAPLVVAGLRGVGAAAGAAWSRIKPDNAAIKALAKRFNISAADLSNLYNDFVNRTGRKPGVIELVSQIEAGRVGMLGRQFKGAGQVLREAEEAAAGARPGELRRVFGGAGADVTSVAAETAELAPIVAEARRTVERHIGGRPAQPNRLGVTEAAQITRRGRSMDAVMERIGNHRVPLSDDMREMLEHADVQSVLPGALRRRINDVIDQGESLGTVDMSMRTWEMLRYEMSKRSGAPGASQIYSTYRNRIRDYVGERVPEYAAALREFGRRSETAEMTTRAAQAVSKDAREFADMIRTAVDQNPQLEPSLRVAGRIGSRKWLSDQLSASPQHADRVLRQLGRDSRLRTNLRAVLSDREMQQLEDLGRRYGYHLNIIRGVEVGRGVVPAEKLSGEFREAVRQARAVPGGGAGAAASSRSALIAKGTESPGAAVGMSAALAKSRGLQERIADVLGAGESVRLQQAGEAFTRSSRNLSEAVPGMSPAQQEAAERAQRIYKVITGAVAASGTASGALKAHLLQRMVERVGLGAKAAERAAELATDPALAPQVIQMLVRRGVSPATIQQWYLDAASAAGILSSRVVQ